MDELRTTPRDDRRPGAGGVDVHLIAALRRISVATGQTPVAPTRPRRSRQGSALSEQARALGLRLRRVRLRATSWWRNDNGPLLAFRSNGRPVALLPGGGGAYWQHDPATGRREKITAVSAAALKRDAFTFYRQLPDRSLTLRQLLGLAVRSMRLEPLTAVTAGLGASVVALAVPLAAALLLGPVATATDRPVLWQLVLGLLAATLGGLVFDLGRELTILRLRTKADLFLQPAIWDRVLRLPVALFRDKSPVEMAERAHAVEQLPSMLGGTLPSAAHGVAAIGFSLALLFYFDSRLAWVATAVVALGTVARAAVASASLRDEGERARRRVATADWIGAILESLGRLRLANRQQAAVAIWKHRFAAEQRAASSRRRAQVVQRTFEAGFDGWSGAVVLVAVALGLHGRGLNAATLVGFMLALGQCLASGRVVTEVVLSVRSARLTRDRLEPLLRSRPESGCGGCDPGDLSGHIEVDGVRYTYPDSSVPALEEVSVRILPGRVTAIVGPSGSGKSTLLRLLLGFERPQAGTIRYDGVDLSNLDLEAVRAQLGAVLQEQPLGYATIRGQITGLSAHSLEEAWDAAKVAAIEQEIERLPMGMQTFVGDSLVSTGQKQRLLIARAIIQRPRILFLDEATTALDELIQSRVLDNLRALNITMIIVSHRLSAVAKADYVYVLDNGRVAQQGTHLDLRLRGGRIPDRSTVPDPAPWELPQNPHNASDSRDQNHAKAGDRTSSVDEGSAHGQTSMSCRDERQSSRGDRAAANGAEPPAERPFRPEALARLSSPEGIDNLATLGRSRGRMVLAAAASLLLLVLLLVAAGIGDWPSI